MTGQLGICCAKTSFFHQMTDQTNYVGQNRTELKWDYNQMTSQRHDSYDLDAIWNKYLEKLGMRYPNKCKKNQN